MIAFRRLAALALFVALALSMRPPIASGAAEVHRLSLVLSSNPSQINAGDFNDLLGSYNRNVLNPRGLQGIDKVGFGWYHQAELRYFVRPNVSVSAGVGQIKSQSMREFLPRIGQAIQLHASVLSVPVHVGGAYYLAPYNQGDFQARAYLGGGFVSLTNNKATFERIESHTDSITTLGGNFRTRAVRDSPGYYLEAGAHMFFAIRYSVMLGVIYRGAKVRDMLVTHESVDPRTRRVTRTEGTPFDLDTGGIGARMAVAIGF